jgi:hypothetical protein
LAGNHLSIDSISALTVVGRASAKAAIRRNLLALLALTPLVPAIMVPPFWRQLGLRRGNGFAPS